MAIAPSNPQGMCARCQHIFPADAQLEHKLTCPACGHEGRPARVMRSAGFPSLEAFTRNWQAAQQAEDRDA